MTSRQSARKGSTKRSASPAAVPMMMEAAPTPKATKTEKKPKSSSKNKVEPKPAAVKASKKKIVKMRARGSKVIHGVNSALLLTGA